MHTLDSIKNCRAVRYYREDAVPVDILASILDAGRAAGSGKNMQLWHFIVVTDREKREALADTGDYAAHFARAAFGVVTLSEVNPHVPAIAYFDAGRAAQNMMLAATAHGLGSCPAGFRRDPERAAALLDVPDDREIVIGIAFGYPDETRAADEAGFRQRVLDRQGRKPLTGIVSENVYGAPFSIGR